VASVLEKIKLSYENSKWETASAICNQVIYFIHEDKADTGEGGNADNPQKDQLLTVKVASEPGPMENYMQEAFGGCS